MNTSLLPYVGAYIGGQLAGITLVAIIAKKVMPDQKSGHAWSPDVLHASAAELKKYKLV